MTDKAVIGTIAKDQLIEFQHLKDTVERTLLTCVRSYSGSSAFRVKSIKRCEKIEGEQPST